MKILYKQPWSAGGILDGVGITNCYLKHLITERDAKNISRKPHYHTDYEVHMVEQGRLVYEAQGCRYTINSGNFLLLPPGVLHRVEDRVPATVTFSLTFRTTPEVCPLPALKACVCGATDTRLQETVRILLAEYGHAKPLSAQLMEANVLEMLVLLWRGSGLKEAAPACAHSEEDPRVAIAKQYIRDNIERAPTVADVAAYCHICARQLNRLFFQQEGVTPAAYIQQQRADRIQQLLLDRSLPMGVISERMHFSSEYYFSAFFKKHIGMPPGAYRSMHASK